MAAQTKAAGREQPDTVAIYCPLWHSYDHGNSWKGEGWCEWELLRAARPRFPGHYQPLQPEWGCFDESDPAWAAREIDLAADHGIDVFLFDWYWYSGVRIMEEALERGFLQAANRRRLRFALMWANHDWADYFPAPFDKQWNWLLPQRYSVTDLLRLIDYGAEHYFGEDHYWQVDGRLFFSIFDPARFLAGLGGPAAAREALAAVDERLASHSLPAMHWNAMVRSPEPVAELRQAGFHSTTCYNVATSGKVSPALTEQYGDVMDAHRDLWSRMADTDLPHCPVVTMGWDVTPRCETSVPWPFPPASRSGRHDYPYGPVVLGNTPDRFAALCREAARAAPDSRAFAVFLNAWNEWTEGCYLLPERRTGMAYLEAVREELAGGGR